MQSRDAVVFALVLLLVLVVIYQCAAPCAPPVSVSGGGAPHPHGGKPGRLYSKGFDGFASPPGRTPPPPPRNHEAAHEAERAAWLASGGDGAFDSASGAPPGGEYSEVVARDLVVDERMRENHRRWVAEMKPWSGTSTTVDDLNEALEASTHFVGLRRPQGGVPVENPLQLTEQGPETFARNARFNFRG
jgi:hypothetical protein